MLPYLDLHIKYARRGFTFFLDVMLIEYKVEKRKKKKLKKVKYGPRLVWVTLLGDHKLIF